MIRGNTGQKAVQHAEKSFASHKISDSTIRRSAVRNLRLAIKSIDVTHTRGLKYLSIADFRLGNARTQTEANRVNAYIRLLSSKLDELVARKNKALALLGRIR